MPWFKFDHETPDKAQVMRLAALLKLPRTQVIGSLCLMWRWFSEQTSTGECPDYSEIIDGIVEVPGFAAAVEEVGWLVRERGKMRVPEFDRWLGSAHEARRQRQCRQRRKEDRPVTVTPTSRDSHADDRHQIQNQSQLQTQTQNLEKKNAEAPTDAGSLPPPAAPAPASTPAKRERKKSVEWTGAIPEPLRTPAFIAAWEGWLRFRQIEHPRHVVVTQTAGDLQLRQFEAWGPERSVRAIEHTQRNQWQGIREPDAEPTSRTGWHRPTARERQDAEVRAGLEEIRKVFHPEECRDETA